MNRGQRRAADKAAPRPPRAPAVRARPEARVPVYVLRSEAWRDLSPLARHVFLAIAAHADERGEGAYPSHRRLANMTGAWRTSVYAELTELLGRGWLVRYARWEGHRRISDAYRLAYPGDAGECHAQVLALLSGKADEITHPLFRTGDVFTHHDQTFIRTTRLDVDVLGSAELVELRKSSGLAFGLYAVLSAHTGHGRPAQHATKAEIARWLHCSVRHVGELEEKLVDGGWVSIERRTRGKLKLASAYSLVERTTTLGSRLGGWAEDAPMPAVPAASDPAADPSMPSSELIEAWLERWPEYRESWREMSAAELWYMLRHCRVVEEAPGEDEPVDEREAPRLLVKAFHEAMRPTSYAQHYEPLPVEVRAARELLQRHRALAWEAVAYAVDQLRRTRTVAQRFGPLTAPLVDEFVRARQGAA